MDRIPFIPLKMEKIKGIANHFLGFGEAFSHLFPSMNFNLEQADIDLEAREWVSICMLGAVFYFIMISGLLFVLAMAARIEILRAVLLSFGSGLLMGGGTFMYLSFYPRLKAGKKIKNLESNLSYVLHHMLVHVRSGVPLFNAMISISREDYGVLSKEFEKVVKEIHMGKSEIDALEMLAKHNPSLYFRRIIWQLVNAMKSGADIGGTLKEIVNNLAVEQRIAIKRYGSELNPLALFYMLLVVIFPTLGIIFMLVLFSFVGTVVQIEFLMMAILMFLTVFQVMFIGIVKTKRPTGV